MNVIEISGARFIKATDAAQKVGYTTDYVGQLARAGKIEAQQIGRVWYVREDDILGHKKGKVRSNKQKTQEALHRQVEKQPEVNPHAIYNSMYTPDATMPEYRKRLLDASVTYEKDEGPLTLSLKRAQPREQKEVEQLLVQADSEEDLVHTTRLGKDLEIVAYESHSELEAHRTPPPPMRGELAITEEREPEALEEEEVYEPAPVSVEPVSRFEARLSERAHSDAATHALHSTLPQLETATPIQIAKRELTYIPAHNLGPRRALSLGPRFVTALVPMVLLLLLAFTCSTIFLEKVIVYEQGKGSESRPLIRTTYNISNVASVLDAVSR